MIKKYFQLLIVCYVIKVAYIGMFISLEFISIPSELQFQNYNGYQNLDHILKI